ncbi:cytochrome ubiquinol oxidase subunit I (plasmid) [Amycolatopsis sp. FU40]|uniref:cytochrome ubiquinol oxidase subunit I n=1 Tax=Amycolatopsis sp. FU40 TaxID=2914159 RepID=UPI001F34CDAC|nr:cytochrome ubiquinol oxidase subunit I [Amycolatopsis sp. FU40]UKD50782.1 cytochrome ubiquinol oxidase subunit I [Amycolatopsis sp. FU40]
MPPTGSFDKDEWIKGHAQEIADQQADEVTPAGFPAPGHQPVTDEHLAAAEAEWYNYSALGMDLQLFGWPDQPVQGSE